MANNDYNDNNELFRSLIEHLRSIAVQNGYNASQIVESRARSLFEITGNNPDLAAQLYWEDFLATQQGQNQPRNNDQHRQPQDPPPQPPPQPIDQQLPSRRRRQSNARSRQQQRAQEPAILLPPQPHQLELAPPLAAVEPPPRMQPQPAQPPARRREPVLPPQVAHDVANLVAQARRQLEDDNVAQLARRAAEALGDNACISDDEGVRGEPPRKRRKTDELDVVKSDDDGGYLSDSDWLWEAADASGDPVVSHPVNLLWGLAPSVRAAGVNQHPQDGSIVIADEDDDETRAGIPRTWLSAGFSLSECRQGLALKPPTDEDIAYFSEKERDGGNNAGSRFIPPPYHCRSVTALLSVVTALIYNGVNVHDKKVSSLSPLEPFQKVPDFDRKRQFDGRLADALAALLTVAAEASRERKMPALQRLKKSDPRKWQIMKKKMKLCPTCHWEELEGDGNNRSMRLPTAQDAENEIQVVTSYTNIEDLRAYVLCNIGAFKGTGGCALFLETLMQIHGKSTVARMIRQSRIDAGLSPDETKLIHCQCHRRHQDKLQSCSMAQRKAWAAEHNMDTTPHQTDCMSIELLSLILTGHVHSTFKGWTTGPLGIGIITDSPNTVSCALTRPERPAWILSGPTCYSTLILKGTQDFPNEFSFKDRPGSIAHFMHWNCWYNVSAKTEFRLVTARPRWEPTVDIDTSSTVPPPVIDLSSGTETRSVVERIIERRKVAQLVDSLRLSVETIPADAIVCQDEMDRVEYHKEDERLFPGRYQLWRYHFKTEDSKENANEKQQSTTWLSYHRLTSRQKLVVEHKLGRNINRLLWTRWPHAVVDLFEPGEPAPMV